METIENNKFTFGDQLSMRWNRTLYPCFYMGDVTDYKDLEVVWIAVTKEYKDSLGARDFETTFKGKLIPMKYYQFENYYFLEVNVFYLAPQQFSIETLTNQLRLEIINKY